MGGSLIPKFKLGNILKGGGGAGNMFPIPPSYPHNLGPPRVKTMSDTKINVPKLSGLSTWPLSSPAL